VIVICYDDDDDDDDDDDQIYCWSMSTTSKILISRLGTLFHFFDYNMHTRTDEFLRGRKRGKISRIESLQFVLARSYESYESISVFHARFERERGQCTYICIPT